MSGLKKYMELLQKEQRDVEGKIDAEDRYLFTYVCEPTILSLCFFRSSHIRVVVQFAPGHSASRRYLRLEVLTRGVALGT